MDSIKEEPFVRAKCMREFLCGSGTADIIQSGPPFVAICVRQENPVAIDGNASTRSSFRVYDVDRAPGFLADETEVAKDVSIWLRYLLTDLD